MAKQFQTTKTSSASGAGAAAARAIETSEQTIRAIDPVGETAPPISVPHPEQIARLAYSYWQARGCPDGSPEEDWFRAESELRM